MARTKSMKVGGGGRFQKGEKAIESREGLSREAAGAIMANAGRKKYGAKKMAKMAIAGKKRAAKGKK